MLSSTSTFSLSQQVRCAFINCLRQTLRVNNLGQTTLSATAYALFCCAIIIYLNDTSTECRQKLTQCCVDVEHLTLNTIYFPIRMHLLGYELVHGRPCSLWGLNETSHTAYPTVWEATEGTLMWIAVHPNGKNIQDKKKERKQQNSTESSLFYRRDFCFQNTFSVLMPETITSSAKTAALLSVACIFVFIAWSARSPHSLRQMTKMERNNF